MEGVLTDDIMKQWGPHPNRHSDVLIYSLGSLDEGHGPALSRRNDDLTAVRTASQASERTGLPYRATYHSPLTGWAKSQGTGALPGRNPKRQHRASQIISRGISPGGQGRPPMPS